VLGSCLALLTSSQPAAAAKPFNDPRWADRWEHLDPRLRNEFIIEATILGDFAGLDIGYRRGIGRHFSLGAMIEYAYPNPGYWQLQGVAHTLEAAIWIKRPWTGVYFSAGLTVGHQFLAPLPELRSVAVGGGAAIGWSWDLTQHINVGFAAGIRRMGVVERSTQICTRPGQCIFTAEGFKPRFTLTFGYRF
jgi:hypothetical protein